MPREVIARPHYEWTHEELFGNLWRAGDLRWLLLPHQREEYDRFRAWNLTRRDPQQIKRWHDAGAYYDNLYQTEWGRRVGKSAFWLVVLVEEMIRYWNEHGIGYRGMLCTVAKEYIGDIYVPLARKLFDPGKTFCPPDFEPIYKGSQGGLHEGFHIPAVDGYAKLVGLDKNPEATRGQFLDGAIITEAAFVGPQQLIESITSVIQPQFQGRPWAFLALESSTAKEPDHPFPKLFRPDCQARGAYSKLTIEDNTSLTPEDIEQELNRVGGRNSAAARREYFCEEVKDDATLLVPEFDEVRHVVEQQNWARPANAIAYVGMDPGTTDKCGIVWFYVDFLRQKIVIEASWAESNRNTETIAGVIKGRENQLWGTGHRTGAPHHKQEVSILDALKPTRDAEPDEQRIEHKWLGDQQGRVLTAPPDSLSYWDNQKHSFCPNPLYRVSDTAPQLILDLVQSHSLQFMRAKKGPDSADAHLQNLRLLFTQDRIRVVRNGLTNDMIAQLRSCTWNEKRTDWARTPLLGHADLIAALMYVARFVDLERNPYPPKVTDIWSPQVAVSEAYRKAVESAAPEMSKQHMRDELGRFKAQKNQPAEPRRFSQPRLRKFGR